MCVCECQVYNKEEQLKSSIVFAREYLKETKISRDQLKYLCEEAIRGGQGWHIHAIYSLLTVTLTWTLSVSVCVCVRLPGPPSGDHRGESGHRLRRTGRSA